MLMHVICLCCPSLNIRLAIWLESWAEKQIKEYTIPAHYGQWKRFFELPPHLSSPLFLLCIHDSSVSTPLGFRVIIQVLSELLRS